ncbi:hypothetical protein [Singulisphaera sp. PoT]|uniref:hypothetical protein n=1 Tax=Singulisphaera sp. PoT TaxID=3411797 RepID=UPI003BF52EFA
MNWTVLARLAAVPLGLIAIGQGAHGQSVPSASRSNNNMATYANPYTNPYANPFLNPYMTQAPVNGNGALYFFAAQQANGGIGSGRLSGVRPAPAPAEPAAPPDDRRLTDVPGGSASRYFNRSPQNPTNTHRYYNRAIRGYPSNRK